MRFAPLASKRRKLMKHRTLRLHALAAGIGLSFLVGCNGCKDNHQSDHSSGSMDLTTHPSAHPSTQAVATMNNERSADSLLAEAAHSEAKGDYDHALVVYQYLQGFPEASRPKDLDQRIDAVKQKMQAHSQR
jgi:hypothetical protein